MSDKRSLREAYARIRAAARSEEKDGAIADSRLIITMEWPEAIRYGIPARATKATAVPEQTTMRNKRTSQTRGFSVIFFSLMPPTIMPVMIMLMGPTMEPTSLNAIDKVSGRRMPVNRRIIPPSTARMFGFVTILLILSALSLSNIRIP